MSLTEQTELQPYSIRTCRCGFVMRPARPETKRRWQCDDCGRTAR